MAEKQKPSQHVSNIAGRALQNPKSIKPSEIRDMAGRILADKKNDPQPHKPTATKKK
jgi:hypothetical protein